MFKIQRFLHPTKVSQNFLILKLFHSKVFNIQKSYFHISKLLFESDPYKILGVERNATKEEIKKKYLEVYLRITYF